MDLTKRLIGKTAVVTAAGQGIGRAVAERLLDEGAEVHASELNGAALADFAIGERGGDPVSLCAYLFGLS